MVVPKWFSEQLKVEQGLTYRVRWSNARECFVIEQKAGRGLTTPPRKLVEKLDRMRRYCPDMADEIMTRARDGYLLFLEVHPSGRAGCPKCGAEVRLLSKVMQFAQCGVCKKDFPAVHFELSDDVLRHLRYLDINRGGDERILEDQDRENEAKEKSEKRELLNSVSDSVWDDWRNVLDVPHVSLNGPRFEAPAAD